LLALETAPQPLFIGLASGYIGICSEAAVAANKSVQFFVSSSVIELLLYQWVVAQLARPCGTSFQATAARGAKVSSRLRPVAVRPERDVATIQRRFSNALIAFAQGM
jgi:hypothetical protein